MNARKTKTVIPIVIAVAVLGAAMAVLSTSAPVAAQQSNASSTAGGQTNNNAMASPSAATVSPIKMSAKEESETYRWSTSDGSNPTLKMSANTNNVVQIANPTDAKHELVIESNGKELASSGDIAPNGSGQLEFKPTAAGTFEYHCEYHPTTMKGTIEVAPSS